MTYSFVYIDQIRNGIFKKVFSRLIQVPTWSLQVPSRLQEKVILTLWPKNYIINYSTRVRVCGTLTVTSYSSSFFVFLVFPFQAGGQTRILAVPPSSGIISKAWLSPVYCTFHHDATISNCFDVFIEFRLYTYVPTSVFPVAGSIEIMILIIYVLANRLFEWTEK